MPDVLLPNCLPSPSSVQDVLTTTNTISASAVASLYATVCAVGTLHLLLSASSVHKGTTKEDCLNLFCLMLHCWAGWLGGSAEKQLSVQVL